jgi:hypothetical protein
MNRSIFIVCLLISSSTSAQLLLEKDPQSGHFFFRNAISKKKIVGEYTYVSTDNLNYFNVLNTDQFLKSSVQIEEVAPDDRRKPAEETLPAQSYTQPRFLKVRKGKLWGYLDGDAKEILPVQYAQLPEPVTPDLFVLKKGPNMVLINRRGESVFSAEKIMFLLEHCEVIPYRNGGNWGFLDKNGKVCADANRLTNEGIKLEHLYEQFKPEHRLVVFRQGEKYGVMNMVGDIVHAARFMDQIQVHQDLIIASVDGSRYGAINHKGDTVADFKYKSLSNFAALVGTLPSGKKDLIFSDGSAMQVDNVVSSFGDSVVISQKGKKGCVDLSEKKMIIAPRYDEIQFDKSMVVLRQNGVNYLLNGNDTIYKGPFNVQPYYDHPIYKVLGPGGEGIYRSDHGKIVLAPENVYVSVDKFNDQYFIIYRKSYQSPRFGLLKDDGQRLEPPFPGVLKMFEGTTRPLFYCIEKLDEDRSASNKIAVLDEHLRDTNLLTEFDFFEPISTNQQNFAHFIIVKKKGKLGLLNMELKQVLPCEYDELYYYQPDSRYYSFRKGNEYGLKKFSELK